MAGWDDIDNTVPAGGDLISNGDNVIRQFKTDFLTGAGVEHHNSGAEQGMHKFPRTVVGSRPASPAAGNLHFTTDEADGYVPYVADAATTWHQAGLGAKTIASGTTTVNTTVSTAVTLQAYSASHRAYVISAYTNSANNPTIVLGVDDTGADIYVYIQKDEAGNDELVISNQTANNEDIVWKVWQLVGVA